MTNNTNKTVVTTTPATRTPKKYTHAPILCVETGTIYATMRDAEKALGLSQGSVSKVIAGKYKSALGYTFKAIVDTVENTTIARQSAITINAKGKYTNRNCKPVLCIETGEIYASCKEAADAVGVTSSNISWAITGRMNTCKGMHFVLVDNIKEQIDRVTGVIRTKNAECKAKDEVIASKTKAYDEKIAELASKTSAYNEIAAKCEAIRAANEIVTSLEASRAEALKLLEKIDTEIAAAKAELNNLIKEM